MNNEEYEKVYNQTLKEIKDMLDKTIHPTKYINTKGMSRKEKEQLIIDLQDKIYRLQCEIVIRKRVNDQITSGLIDSKYQQVTQLLHNPLLTLPSGKQVYFSSLNDDQIQYLESLASEKHL